MKDKLFSLGGRLSTCAEFVRRGSRFADIGTDHAYLPVWLVKMGLVQSAIASDINEGPIEAAKEHIAMYGAGDKVRTIVADGLKGVRPDEADDIVIAGMGGELIARILNDAPWVRDGRYRLILQPMTHPERLRRYLVENGFCILDEKAVCEGRKVYTTILAAYSEEKRACTERDIYLGGLAGKRDDASRRYLAMQAMLLRAEAKGCRHSGDDIRASELESIAQMLEEGE
ncbi:MAG: SAM-dependent methyltransferase [Clostridia bacterium]|nr:SAM-dependent methyltransferase [Clostridia bacterium]